jgi:hypothetical protein
VPQEPKAVVTAAPVQAEKIVPATSEKAASAQPVQPTQPAQPAQPAQKLAATQDADKTGAQKSRMPVMLAAGVAAAAAFAGGGYWFFAKPSQTPAPQAIAMQQGAPVLEQPNQAATPAAPSVAADNAAPAPQQPAPDVGITGMTSDLENALRCKGLENTDAIEAAVKKAGFERMRAPDGERKYNASKITLFGVPAESVSFYGNNASEMASVDAVLVAPKSAIAGKVAKLTTLKAHQFNIQASGTDKTRVVCAIDGSGDGKEPVQVAPPAPVRAQPKPVPAATPQKHGEAVAPTVKQVAPNQPAKAARQAGATTSTKPNLDAVYSKAVAEKGCDKGFLGVFCREPLKIEICREHKAFGSDPLCPASDPKDHVNANLPN